MTIHLAGCVILDNNRNIYLLHRNKNGVVQWELPGGKVESGETTEQAAIREIEEELDIVVSLTRKLGEATFMENKMDYSYTWYLAEVMTGNMSICEPESFDGLRAFSFSELSHIKLSNNMKLLASVVLKTELSIE
jgi:8-oxo-dGTP diphosphatase